MYFLLFKANTFKLHVGDNLVTGLNVSYRLNINFKVSKI